MKTTVLLAIICLCGWPLVATSQVIGDQKGCQSAYQMCSLECRARHFLSDPMREQCIRACSATAAKCTQTSVTACLSQSRCAR
jgi:hypothetical protein